MTCRASVAALLIIIRLYLVIAGEVCERVTDSAACSFGEKPPASLLQRVYHRDPAAAAPLDDEEVHVHAAVAAHTHATQAKAAALIETSVHANHTRKQDVKCSGVVKQGRCWYLSEMGESCKSTCSRNGRIFSFVVADQYDPVTPVLVGHHPRTKQEPWAVLECWVPGEDRYHTASANAARQMVNDIGDWLYESCKLACPCGGETNSRAGMSEGYASSRAGIPDRAGIADSEASGDCSWKQPPACAPEFEYKGVMYTGCPTVDHNGQPWCMHHHHHTELEGHHDSELHADEWSECVWSCGGTESYTMTNGCKWKLAPGCLQEFDYEGTHYVGCTSMDHDTPWCSMSDPYDRQWDHCTYECPNEASDEVNNQNLVTLSDDLLCSWMPPANCSTYFEYKGTDYTACTDVDHPTPWCSHDRRHKGNWSLCTRECIAPITKRPDTTTPRPFISPTPSPFVYTTPLPREIPPSNAPCARHPETENDIIGMTVDLTEAGYQTAVRTSSAVNIKRFVCRVVDKLDCEVNDYASLMGFVPYYSGAVTRQTYAHLEHELEILCHAGGKWVQVKS